MEICIIENPRINICKTVCQFTIEPLKCFSSHDTIQCLNCVVHYLNIKMKEKPVDIIDLQLGSLLK